jgi:hypothetical protein
VAVTGTTPGSPSKGASAPIVSPPRLPGPFNPPPITSGSSPTPPPAPPGTPGSTGDPIKDLTGANRDAYAALVDLFNSYGLGTLAPTIFNFIKQGYGADTITLLLQDTPEYKQRFAGNAARLKAGLPVLSPAQYLATESSYRAIMQDAGLPKGFYDQPSDFTNWIGGDVSPTELKGRVDLAVSDTTQAPDEVKQALKEMYGIDQGAVTAYFLDRSRSLPTLQIQAQAAQIGGAAIEHGFTPAGLAEQFAREGVTTSQAQAGYAQLAETFHPMQAIAQRFGTDWTQGEAEQGVFEPGSKVGGVDVTQKAAKLQDQEKALFSGNTAAVSYVGLSAGSQQQ